MGQQELKGYLSAETRIFSQIDLPHSANPESADDAIWTEVAPNHRLTLVQRLGQQLKSGCFKEVTGLIVRCNQSFDLTVEGRIGGARFSEEARSVAAGSLERRLQESLNSLPTFGGHGIYLFDNS